MLGFFFFNDTATTEIYTLSLHDALPISGRATAAPRGGARRTPLRARASTDALRAREEPGRLEQKHEDRKSTRLNSSHANISYAVFCLKKKQTQHSTSCPLTPTPSGP